MFIFPSFSSCVKCPRCGYWICDDFCPRCFLFPRPFSSLLLLLLLSFLVSCAPVNCSENPFFMSSADIQRCRGLR